MRATTLVLGIGNILWADEGFGVRAVAALDALRRFPDSVALMDGGTQGLYLLPHVQAARRLLVFDAIDFGLEPGTLRVFRDGAVPAASSLRKMSLHQSSFEEVLALARLSGEAPERIALVGVQPQVLDDFGGSLSEAVRLRLPEALDAGVAILSEWGVGGTPREVPPEVPLCDASLAIDPYESGRPSDAEACRAGDARWLELRARAETR